MKELLSEFNKYFSILILFKQPVLPALLRTPPNDNPGTGKETDAGCGTFAFKRGWFTVGT
jgi:hypothetical protein